MQKILLILIHWQVQASSIQNLEIPAAPHQKMYNNSIMMANFMLSNGLNGKLD
jgi:hypothetical protein